MPKSVLKFVAVIIGICALAGLVLGFLGAPEKGRLPGEVEGGAPAAPLTASELLPLDEAPPPPPPAPAEAKVEEAPKAETLPAELAPPVVPPQPMPAPAKPAAPAEDRVGDLLDGVTPPPTDDPPH